jgi:hypothetical protein
MSGLDAAFTILALKNYWACWHEGATARWTDSKQVKYQYMEWADVAYTRFDQLCTLLQVQRLGMCKGPAGGRWGCTFGEHPIGQAARGMEVYHELDNEE